MLLALRYIILTDRGVVNQVEVRQYLGSLTYMSPKNMIKAKPLLKTKKTLLYVGIE